MLHIFVGGRSGGSLSWKLPLSLTLCISETVMAGGRARTRYWFSSSSLLGVYEVGVMKQDSSWCNETRFKRFYKANVIKQA